MTLTHQAVALRCPVCGAPREPGAGRCAYCGSWLLALPDPLGIGGADETIVREHIERFRQTLQRAPDDLVALHGLGVAYRNLGLLEDATRVLARAASTHPEMLGVQRALAGTLLDAVRLQPAAGRMWRDVRRQADRVIALDPTSREGWWLRAEVALRTGDRAGLIEVIPDLVLHDQGDNHAAATSFLADAAERDFHDWRWSDAIDAWEALALLDPDAGRTALVGFLLQNVRLVPRSAGLVWRALRQTVALGGGFRQAMIAAVAMGIAGAFIVVAIALAFAAGLFPAVTVAFVVLPLLAWLILRWRLVGSTLGIDRHPWDDVPTEEIVRVARAIAPAIDRVRPTT